MAAQDFVSTAGQDSDPRFKTLVDDVARQIVGTEHRPSGSFVRTPLLYPSGATVVVRIEDGQDRYFVSDMGMGYQEAEMMGASLTYARSARSIAENAGVRFDNQAFFVLEASRDQLPGAVVTIANCSLEAASLAAYEIAARKEADDAERLYERLVGVFAPKSIKVEKHVDFIGSSNTKWTVAALVRSNRPTIFEPVINHPSSVAHVSMKLRDIGLLEQPPNRVAVAHRKNEFGTYLGVLTQSADVVDDAVTDATILRLSKAA